MTAYHHFHCAAGMSSGKEWALRWALTAAVLGIAPAASAGTILADAVLNPQPGYQDLFGSDVAWVNGLAAVGASWDTVNGVPRAGDVYLLAGSGPSFGTTMAVLRSPLPTTDGWFGNSIAASGSSVIVGSYGAGIPFFRTGAAYVYDGDPTSATFGDLTATLRNPRPNNNDKFGFNVSTVGNPTIGNYAIVGAYADSTLASATGAAYMFNVNRSSPNYGKVIHTFENPTPQAGDYFGVQSVGVAGNKVLIGSFRDDTAGVDSGAAHLFDANPLSPTFGTLLHTFVNPSPSPTRPDGTNDEFGHYLASKGNYVFISAFRKDVGGQTAAGAVYMYDADPQSPTFGQLLKTFVSPNPQAGANFGFSVEAIGNDLLVGAWREDGARTDSGAVYRFDADPNSPTFGQLIDYVPAPFGMGYEQFGTSLAVGTEGILVGALGTLTVGAGYLYADSAADPSLLDMSDADAEILAEVPEPAMPLAFCGIALWLAGRWRARKIAKDQ